ncbi:MAG: hypothetical protein G01um101433_904 [Parcubacteria group bacterium Gr01-1014_33]|nr:MAG: hypothetical protein G01um101433_904 [Parcubacteria group bacterium Gr01-1014_33]
MARIDYLASIKYTMSNMDTITLPKKKYQRLEKQAALYQNILKMEKGLFPIERYSDSRLKEFLQEDQISPSVRRKAKRLLKKK